MPPNNLETENKSTLNSKNDENLKKEFKFKINWLSVLKAIVWHMFAIYSVYYSIIGNGNWKTYIWFWLIGFFGNLGVLAGSHRLWSHKSYKAKLPLRILLAILQTIAFQNSIFGWARDHRVHHKYSDTDADPHNANRGFFFSHMGWFLCEKHPQVIAKGNAMDLSDLLSDPVVRFQRRYFVPLGLIFWGIIPTVVPMYLFGEPLFTSICGNTIRYIFFSHNILLVNSVAHMYGMRPYDTSINPSENSLVIYASMGEGYHNYHHTFPYDYSASEFGWKTNFNPATAFIDFFARIGWAYDRKVVSTNTITDRIGRTGDYEQKTGRINYWFDLIKGFLVLCYPLIIIFCLRLIFAN